MSRSLSSRCERMIDAWLIVGFSLARTSKYLHVMSIMIFIPSQKEGLQKSRLHCQTARLEGRSSIKHISIKLWRVRGDEDSLNSLLSTYSKKALGFGIRQVISLVVYSEYLRYYTHNARTLCHGYTITRSHLFVVLYTLSVCHAEYLQLVHL